MILKYGHGIQAVCDVSALLRCIAFLVEVKNCRKQRDTSEALTCFSSAYFSAVLMYIFGLKL